VYQNHLSIDKRQNKIKICKSCPIHLLEDVLALNDEEQAGVRTHRPHKLGLDLLEFRLQFAQKCLDSSDVSLLPFLPGGFVVDLETTEKEF
jgi:hypothetical protein